MKRESKQGLRRFQLKLLAYANSCYIERNAALEAKLARSPREFQIDMIGDGEISPDTALLIRSILNQRPPKTRIITNARSSLRGGSVLVWLLGDIRIIRDDARLFFRHPNLPDDASGEGEESLKNEVMIFSDSYSEIDPEEADYAKMLEAINEFLPVNELKGRPISVPMLRQFGLMENEKLDHFLADAFGRPPKAEEASLTKSKEKRLNAHAKEQPQSGTTRVERLTFRPAKPRRGWREDHRPRFVLLQRSPKCRDFEVRRPRGREGSGAWPAFVPRQSKPSTGFDRLGTLAQRPAPAPRYAR